MSLSKPSTTGTEKENTDRLWEELYKRYRTCVRNYAYRILKDESAAEDIVQDTFVRLRPHLLDVAHADEKKMRSYLFAIARNLSIDRINREKREPCMPQEDINDMAGYSRSPEETFIARENMKHCVATLNDDSKEVLRLRYVMNYPVKRIAATLGISTNLVTVRLFRARKLLKKRHERDW